MKVKKYTCTQCGAPKINPYRGVYVCCDYCGKLMDVDAFNWNTILHHRKRQQNLEELHHRTVAKTRKAVQDNNQEAYFRSQQEYWSNYYSIYPEFIPPTVRKGEMFKSFLRLKAKWLTDIKFKEIPGLRKKKSAQNGATEKFISGSDPHFDYLVSFMEMMEAASKYLVAEMAAHSALPEYDLFKQIYPEGFEYKSEMAILAQPYLANLGELGLKHYLKKFGFEYEYAETNDDSFQTILCSACNASIQTIKGAFRCICEECYEMNIIQRSINCTNCASQNELPERWSHLINCSGCGTEIRVVQV